MKYSVFLFVTLFVLAGCGNKYNPERKQGRIVFSDAENAVYLKKGFSVPEQFKKESWRWSDAEESEMAIALEAGKDYRVTINASPLDVNNRTQFMLIRLNGTPVKSIFFKDIKFQDFTIDFPKELVKNDNELVFRYGYTLSPKELGEGTDERKLGVKFQFISFEKK